MTRDEFLHRFSAEPVALEVGGATLHVRPILMGEADEIAAWAAKNPGKDNAIYFVRAVCDADGRRLFSDDDALSLESLIPAGVANEVVAEIVRLTNGGAPAGKARSPATTNSNSSSDSPAS